MPRPKSVTPKIARALFVAGKLGGAAVELDITALQEYLDSNPEGFLYGKLAQAAIDFARIVQNRQ